MAIFQRSKAEDSIDRYNHIWSVIFLLLLSLITWLIPLSPSLSTQAPQPRNSQQNIPVSRNTANCWCPSEFTGSMVMYVNSICAKAFNQAVEGKDNSSHNGDAVLFENTDGVIPIDMNDRKIFLANNKPTMESNWTEISSSEEDKVASFRHFISLKTPLILFIFAICLKLPHVVWTLLSGCVGINISQTLETAKEGQSLDKDSRHQLKQDLALAVSQSAKSTSYSTALLYLLFKVLMCIVVIAELVYIHDTLSSEVKTLENNNWPEKDTSMTMTKNEKISNGPLLCEFSIRQLQSLQSWTVQCVFTAQLSTAPTQMSETSPEQDLPSIYLYKALFTSVMIYLLILFIINVINLLIWIFKLVVGPCRQRVTPNNNLPLDVYLLLYMAQNNVGHLVARDLSVNFDSGNKRGESDEMQEKL